MDSVTQIVLGASVAGICAPPEHRRKALAVGAALGTLPDLDVLIRYDDPVSNFTYHRGFSHSLVVLFPFSLLLWAILRRWWTPVRDAPQQWLWSIVLALVTHPLLDCHTVYGTQLLWPLTTPPIMWSTLFIIDPAYTLPLLLGVTIAVFRPNVNAAKTALASGLVISTLYLGWSWIAKVLVERDTRAALAQLNLPRATHFSVPTPFNTLLWRVVVMTDHGYLEGYRSLVADRAPLQFKHYPTDDISLNDASEIRAVARLRWFAHDFLKSEVLEDKLILTDLRMGVEPTYIFSHVVAVRGNPHWHEIQPQRRGARIKLNELSVFWDRIWNERPGLY